MEAAKKKRQRNVDNSTEHLKKKKTKFEDEQKRLDTLCLMMNDKKNYYYDFYRFIFDFDCAKFNGKSNVLRLYPHLSSIKIMNFIGSNKDSLFIHKNRTYYLYISPHFLCINPPDGRCLSEFISQQGFLANKVANIIMMPNQTVRSYDGYCIECFKNNNCEGNVKYFNLLNDCLNNNNNNNGGFSNIFIWDLFSQFIDNVMSLFIETKYLPYMIHPDRLILTTSISEKPLDSIKIASMNLLSYIFSPQNDEKKILNATFSHPMSFLDKYNGDEITKGINANICFVILDFFHSAFVTSLWILTSGQYQYLSRVKRNSANNQAPIKISREKFNKIEKSWKNCNNDYGFCHGFDKKKKLIHNFGCLHLMRIMPQILEKTINDSSQSLSFSEVETCVQTCVRVFKEFLTNVQKDDDDEDDDDKDEKDGEGAAEEEVANMKKI